jgi:hypothetical protein
MTPEGHKQQAEGMIKSINVNWHDSLTKDIGLGIIHAILSLKDENED